jgi:hypothetical protein
MRKPRQIPRTSWSARLKEVSPAMTRICGERIWFFCVLSESDRLPTIDLPVANALNEKKHGRSMHRGGIQD